MTDLRDVLPSPIIEMFSKKGRVVSFPKMGILAQAAMAKNKTYNATIGVAHEEDGSLMVLPSVMKKINLEADVFRYAPSFGRPDLRKKWAGMIREKNPGLKDAVITLPVVTNALTHGLSMVGHLFVDEGDEIITPDLYWGNYNVVFGHGCGATLHTFPLFKEGEFNLEGLRFALNEGGTKKIVLLNFPNNPTGYTPTEGEAAEITAMLHAAAENGKHVVAILDDAYFGLVYEEGIERESLFARLANLHENVLAVKVDGATKEDYVWGARVGFVTFAYKGMTEEAAEILEDKMAGAIRSNVSNVSNAMQSMMLKAYSSDTYDEEKAAKFETLKARYEKVKEVLAAHPEYVEVFEVLPFNSGYFMCVKLVDGLKAEPLRQLLLEKYDTGVIAVRDDVVRLAFSSIPLTKIEKLFENLYRAGKESLT